MKSFLRDLVVRTRRKLNIRLKRFSESMSTFLKIFSGRVRLGIDVKPLSELFGFDRGLPVHRYYLDQFMKEFASDIRGHCLEFQDPGYTRGFGGSAVTQLDILHIDDSNPSATVVADITKPNNIPSNYFDCIICTHVLHIIFELDKAISELYRILKPGGVLLIAVPHISMCDPEWREFWRFTPEGLYRILVKVFQETNVTIRSYGNSLTAAGQIRGLVTDEFRKAELDYHDPRFAIDICARVIKQI